MVKKVILWLLVAANMIVIFSLSSQPADESNVTSGEFAYRVLNAVSPSFRALSEDEKLEIVESTQKIFRKGAHLSIYALLGFLICLLIMSDCGVKRSLLIAPFAAALYAVTDELHQLFVAGRTGLLGDVAIDFLGAVCGALLAAAILKLIAKIRRRRHEE